MRYSIKEWDEWGVAIVDENGNRISDFYDGISRAGLLSGESDYYIAQDRFDVGGKEKMHYAIFHKDDPINPVSRWGEMVWESGLVKGESDYYILAVRRSFDERIFHKNDRNRAVSSTDKRRVWEEGLVKGESDYYVAIDDGFNKAVYHKDKPHTPVIPDNLRSHHLVKGA